VLVGAVTVLVAIVGAFLAYNANQGLPFVPTKELKVDIANGAQLVAGNDVREGGFRAGTVTDLSPIELPTGGAGAQLTLKLEQSHSRVPVDTTATVLPRSVLGLKYVALTLGNSPKLIPDGETLPLSQTSAPVRPGSSGR
jgi:ABC-type transporter Mla subunit MlaD